MPVAGAHQRNFMVNDYRENMNLDYADNKVTTAKYNFITFLPLNLFFQFTKFANIYFLFLAFLQVSISSKF